MSGLILLFVQQRATIFHHTHPSEVSSQNHSNYRLKVKGFRFDSIKNGEKIFSIKADNFTIEKKKLGFLRLGLINTAVFNNAVLDIYLNLNDAKLSDNKSDFVKASLPSLSKSLPSLPTKRISSVRIEPICLNLWDDKSLFTKITSKIAIIGFKKQNIIFEGNVQVVSGDKHLSANRLNFYPENSLMKVEGHFIFKADQKRIEGEQLAVDLFLNLVNDTDDEIIRHKD
jgi:hypothetical protein